jgi:hypothetical protein
MQESKKLFVRRLGVAGLVAVDLLPYYTTRDVLRKCGARAAMVLVIPGPRMGVVVSPDAELWSQVQDLQRLYAVEGKGSC